MTRRLVMVLAALAALCLVASARPARAAEAECHVRFVSAEYVYLDVGSAAGLDVGLKVRIVREGKAVGELEVAFVAENSASCRIVGSSGAIMAGDRATFVPVAPVAAAATDTLVSRVRPAGAGTGRRSVRIAESFDGWIAVQWDQTSETTNRNLRTDLLSLPFRARVRKLGNDFEFQARGNLRHITRDGYSQSTPASEWRNRVLEAAFVREGRDLGWQFAFGRVGGRRTAAAGPFDGLAVTRRLGEWTSLGVFGGFAPAWGNLAFSTDDHLAGAVFNFNHAGASGRVLDLTVAAIGRYRQGEISREYVSVVTSWRDGARVSLLQAAECDLNRGWRKEKTGGRVALTSLALTGRYQLTPSLAFTLGYDGREPVRTWETRSLPDSLFTDAGRNGWRASAGWRGPGGLAWDLSGGLRSEQGTDDDVTSWQTMLRVPARTLRLADVTVSARGFDGPWMSGWSPSMRAWRTVFKGARWNLEAGRFSYADKLTDTTRDNTWGETGLSLELATGWDVTGSYRRDWGDDITGRRFFLELSRRF
jgi:hypothetical protein